MSRNLLPRRSRAALKAWETRRAKGYGRCLDCKRPNKGAVCDRCLEERQRLAPRPQEVA